MESSPIKKLSSMHTVDEISEEDFQRLYKHFPMCDGYARLNPGGWFVSTALPPILEKLYNFEFRSTDTLVVTYPKSGTTWMQEIVWTLIHNPDLDNPASSISSDVRAPHFEADMNLASKKVPPLPETTDVVKHLKEFAPDKVCSPFKMFTLAETVKSPRVLKTHIVFELLNPSLLNTCKVIYLSRDPRDVILSKYHFYRHMLYFSFQGTLDDFIDCFIQEEQFNHPYWPHVKQAYDLRNHPNLLFLHFEDLKADPVKVVTRVSEFLKLERTPEQIMNVVNYTNFQNMKSRSEDGSVSTPCTADGKYVNTISDSDGSIFRKVVYGNALATTGAFYLFWDVTTVGPYQPGMLIKNFSRLNHTVRLHKSETDQIIRHIR